MKGLRDLHELMKEEEDAALERGRAEMTKEQAEWDAMSQAERDAITRARNDKMEAWAEALDRASDEEE